MKKVTCINQTSYLPEIFYLKEDCFILLEDEEAFEDEQQRAHFLALHCEACEDCYQVQ